MWPASTSTTMPSGIFRASATIVFTSDPSGLHDITRLPARSKKKRRATGALGAAFLVLDRAASVFLVITSLIAHLLTLRLRRRREGSRRPYGIGQFRRY